MWKDFFISELNNCVVYTTVNYDSQKHTRSWRKFLRGKEFIRQELKEVVIIFCSSFWRDKTHVNLVFESFFKIALLYRVLGKSWIHFLSILPLLNHFLSIFQNIWKSLSIPTSMWKTFFWYVLAKVSKSAEIMVQKG